MRTLKGSLALAALLCAMPATQAEFVIDNFSGPGAGDTGSANTMRTSATLVGGGFLFPAGAGSLTGVAGAAGAGFDLTYAIGAAAPNPTGFGYFSSLALDLIAVGDWEVSFTISNGIGPDGDSIAPTFIGTGSTVALVDLVPTTHTSNLNGLSELTLQFRNLTDDTGSRVLTLTGITAVPEPTSIALLGLTGLGGVVVVRRRRKSEKTA